MQIAVFVCRNYGITLGEREDSDGFITRLQRFALAAFLRLEKDPLDVVRVQHVLLITLNKSDKEYSPTTMYNDYSINSSLFHWQSQSTTSADAPTGQRYINHRSRGSNVLLFVRETKSDACGAAPYTFLGTADYVSHISSRPMNIVWRLHQEIPAKYLRKTQQVIGY